MIKVTKFGGSSLASASQFKKVADIILVDETRRYVVPSAPGKRFPEDVKVTDMLYACYDLANHRQLCILLLPGDSSQREGPRSPQPARSPSSPQPERSPRSSQPERSPHSPQL